MRYGKWPGWAAGAACVLALAACGDEPAATAVAPGEVRAMRGGPGPGGMQQAHLGQSIYFDTDLSLLRNQACASCHDPAWGFTLPDAAINAHGAVAQGSVAGRFGNRRPSSASYATPAPVFDAARWTGGLFWDGRATGFRLGSPAAQQAQGPFLNPREHALRDTACVVFRVSRSAYAAQYVNVYGSAILQIGFPAEMEALCSQEGPRLELGEAVREQVRAEYDNIAWAIAGFEASPLVNAYSSRFDAYRAGRAALTVEERRGLALFEGRAGCAGCHPSTGSGPLFTRFTYANLGVPKNPENPVYLEDPGWVDYGLGGATGAAAGQAAAMGLMKVPTLRNVDLRPYPGAVKAYMHNGVFKSLEQVVHFLNTRDVLPRCEALAAPRMGVNCWPRPEVEQNLSTAVGRLGLSVEEEAAVVAFMRTLSDGAFRHRWGMMGGMGR